MPGTLCVSGFFYFSGMCLPLPLDQCGWGDQGDDFPSWRHENARVGLRALRLVVFRGLGRRSLARFFFQFFDRAFQYPSVTILLVAARDALLSSLQAFVHRQGAAFGYSL